MRVLIVDDNELHLKLGKILIEKMGHDVYAFSSVKELSSGLKNIPEADIALIDYRLGEGTTGVDALNLINESGWNQIRVVALTADVSEKATLNSAGFHDVLFKPVTESLLEEIIAKHE